MGAYQLISKANRVIIKLSEGSELGATLGQQYR